MRSAGCVLKLYLIWIVAALGARVTKAKVFWIHGQFVIYMQYKSKCRWEMNLLFWVWWIWEGLSLRLNWNFSEDYLFTTEMVGCFRIQQLWSNIYKYWQSRSVVDSIVCVKPTTTPAKPYPNQTTTTKTYLRSGKEIKRVIVKVNTKVVMSNMLEWLEKQGTSPDELNGS